MIVSLEISFLNTLVDLKCLHKKRGLPPPTQNKDNGLKTSIRLINVYKRLTYVQAAVQIIKQGYYPP